MKNQKTRKSQRRIRHRRIRAVIFGTASRPRLAVYRSDRALSVQIINDEKGITMVSKRSKGKNIAAACSLGKDIAALSVRKKITSVVFDRGGNRYHGAVKALADALREGGLIF